MNELTQQMIAKAAHALRHAYAPYSKYSVAACIYTSDHDFFTGVNVENSSYGLTICAESCAIAQMIASGQRLIQHIVIMAGNNELCAPCGACRQRIFEFANSDTQVHLCNQTSLLKTFTINELLPLAFKLL